MDYVAVWIIGTIFIGVMAFFGLVYTIAWIIDFVMDKRGEE